jgi:phosphonate transport system substrate-binding protein
MGIADFPFSFGSESSTSGRLMPEYFIRKETGKAPKEFFKKGFTFSGAHDKTATSVAEGGAVKCGALSYRKYDSMVEKGELDPEQCPIVWTTPFYADYNFTAHPVLEKRFGAGFTDKLQQALIDMEAGKLVEGFLRTKFIAAKNEDFAATEEIARELGLLR